MSEETTGLPPTGVFISAVSSEFGSAREAVADSLKRTFGVEVKDQRTFNQRDADTTLGLLHNYIKDSAGVICVIGKRSGAVPETVKEEYLGWLPDDFERASYTQWELIFARRYEKRPRLFVATENYKPELAAPADDDPEIQRRFVRWIEREDMSRASFDTPDGLSTRVLESSWSPPEVGGQDVFGTAGTDGAALVEQRTTTPQPREVARIYQLPVPSGPYIPRGEAQAKLEKLMPRLTEDLIAGRKGDRIVALLGPTGVGKRTLLGHVLANQMQVSDTGRLAPISSDASDQGDAEDSLQSIFEDLFVTEPATVLPEARSVLLASRAPLVVVTDVESSGASIKRAHDAMPLAHFFITAPAFTMEARKIPVRGFTDQQSILTLFSDRYFEEVEPSLTPRIEALGLKLNGNPKLIEMLAMKAYEEVGEATPLSQWLDAMDDKSPDQLRAALLPKDEAGEVVDVLSAAEVDVPLQVLLGLVPRPAIDEALASGAIREGSPRYGTAADLPAEGPAEVTMEKLFAGAISWSDYSTATEIFGNRAFVVRMMEWGLERGLYEGVVALGEATETAMALGRRHGVWEQVLVLTAEAARKAKPQLVDAEARAIHQLGSRALLRGELGKARPLLYEALRRRPQTAARARQITRQNLRLMPAAVFTLIGLLAWFAVAALFVGAGAATAEMYDAEPGAAFDPVHAPAGGLTIVPSGELQANTSDGSFGRFEVEIDSGPGALPPAFCLTDGTACVAAEAGDRNVVGRDGGCDLQISSSSGASALVPNQGSCHLWLGFQPTIPGDFEAEITLAPGPEAEPLTGVLTGSGTSPISEIDPDVGDFSAVGEVETFRVTNLGNASFRVVSFGVMPPGFELVTDECSGVELLESDSCVVSIRSSATARSGLVGLTVVSDSGMVEGDREILLIARR